MKVLHFVHTYGEKNGISLHVKNLAKAMPKGIKTQVIAGSGAGLPLFSSLRLPAIEFARALGADFDVMHIHGYGNFYSFFGAAVSLLKGRPLVWTVHGYPRIKGARRLFYYVYRYLMAPFIFWRASAIISVSDDVVALLGKETSKEMLVLPNGVDFELFAPSSQYTEGKFACYVGRLDPDKGAGRLMECEALPLLFIGPDEDGERERLQKKAASLGRKAEFIEVPYEKMPSAYERCRYVVLPSKYEGFPLTLLESVAMGRPFISNDVGQVKAVMGRLGLPAAKFLLTGDIGKKIEALEKENLAKEIESAREKLAAYSWERVAGKTAKVYRDVIGRG
jgi:glycosyltransferase involved in cell wall biosynthesis